MFQKAQQEDLQKKNDANPPALTLSQKHRITKKKGDPKAGQIFSDKKKLQSSSTNFLSAAQFSNRPQGQVEITSYPNREVDFF